MSEHKGVESTAISQKSQVLFRYHNLPSQFIPHVDRIRGAPVVEKGRIAPYEGDGEPLEQPLDGGALLLPSVPCQEASHPLQLDHSTGVPSSQTLCCQWNEVEALAIASLPRLV